VEFHQELESGNGPVFLKLDHLAEETIQNIEEILHSNERPSRGQFHANRGTDYRTQMVEMHISEIGFCSGHSASGCGSTSAETSVKGLYSAGDMAAVPHNYMLGAFTYGWFAGQNAADFVAGREFSTLDAAQIERESAGLRAAGS
jgi:succinate dehydrogenase/fumarate reductase flavoprotein subunit